MTAAPTTTRAFQIGTKIHMRYTNCYGQNMRAILSPTYVQHWVGQRFLSF